ncbi:hypothetical protein GGQ85_001802 [Nitrobacter vulgaris]|jgi:hypothetical protein|uniref:Uncharacterized protein n=1 Tax=Nitrobacter vulgaris TaxID=29421 RepID=A0A1V4I0Y6_NITVU|nr:hypothetical protein [Nitrobacter vulgaris]MDR6304101.1 hypothetical protein [Nitrobacter vulgaris]OPH83896.1 hypothetical protein B2M20_04320 [Nitrobacter vulgaris]
MDKVSNSVTKLQATFRITLNGESVAIATVGQAYDFITRLSTAEWVEFSTLHEDACAALEAAAGNAMLSRKATDALRALFARTKLL